MRSPRPVLLLATAALILPLAGCGGDEEPVAQSTTTLVTEPVTRLEMPATPEDEPVATTTTEQARPSTPETAALKRDRAYWDSRSASQQRAIAQAYLDEEPARARYEPARVAKEADAQFESSPLKPRTIRDALVEAVSQIATDDLEDSLDDIDELTDEG